MATLLEEEKRAEGRGDKTASKWKGAQPALENLGLEIGDQFTLPMDYTGKIKDQKFGTNETQYILVQIGNEDNWKPFYPSTFNKRRQVFNEDGTPTGERMVTKGSAALLFRQGGSVEAGMDLLKGKTLRVTNIEPCRTLRFGTTDSLTTAQIPTIEIVEETANA